MKNSTKIVLVALAAIALVSTVAVLIPRATHVLAATTTLSATSPRTPWANYCAPIEGVLETYVASCTITAPSGGELVIQMISGFQFAPLASHLTAQVLTVVRGSPTAINWTTWLARPVVINGHDLYDWSYPITLYADPGSTITVQLVNQTTQPLPLTSSNARITMVGYYVPPPG
jgi:hypothetical protein